MFKKKFVEEAGIVLSFVARMARSVIFFLNFMEKVEDLFLIEVVPQLFILQ